MTTELHLNIHKKIFVIAFLLQNHCTPKIWHYTVYTCVQIYGHKVTSMHADETP